MNSVKELKKYAWYFPNWHVDPYNEQWHGKNWTEWEVLKHATPRFEGHNQPVVPLWGYEDESDPSVFAKKISCAERYGLNGFIFDFYWYKSVGPFRKKCLEEGFLKADNSKSFEFGINWCNHDPIYVHPAQLIHHNPEMADGTTDLQLFYDITEYCIHHYFGRKNYMRVNGKCYFGIWNVARLMQDFGGLDGLRIALQDFRNRAAKAGFEIYLTAQSRALPGFREDNFEQVNRVIKELGIDSVFNYTWDPPKSAHWPTLDYPEMQPLYYAKVREYNQKFAVPYDANVIVGGDISPRTVQSDCFEEGHGYPYNAIFVNNTPKEVEKSFEMMRSFLQSGESTGNIMTVSCWNEWTEGAYLEPDTKNGYAFLEAFNRVFNR